MTFSITTPRCEYLDNPLGLDIPHPRLSWRLATERRGARQTSYRLIAAATPADLAAEQNLLWDSGTVASDQSTHVTYDGPPAGAGERIWWQVQVIDDAGNRAASEPAWWEAGLLEPGDWQAHWIGADLVGGPRTSAPAPFLRRAFTIGAPVASARLYITALGVYECVINGRRVGEDIFAPGWTDYRIRVQYQVYDVTELLAEGENVIGAILGDGWYCGYVAWNGRQGYGDRPRLLAQLAIEYADGSRATIVSDEAWKTRSGPILQSDMLMGESYDARLDLGAWHSPGYDDGAWLPAVRFADPGIAISGARGPAVRRIEEIRPVAEPTFFGGHPGGRWVFDLGQNMVGWVRLRVSGARGTTIILRFAEALNPDGTIYTANLRSALQTDHYTLAGEGVEEYEPRFTFHGFRYVEMRGYQGKATADMITGVVVHSATAPTGTFGCSSQLINQLQRNIVWGQKGNFVDVPTDCPQRDERLGWTGDAQVFIRTAAFNMDVSAFFTRWLRDLEDAQSPEGAYPPVAPFIGLPHNDGGPAWADAGTICPWTLYLCYGDTRILEERYDSMARYIAFLEKTSRDLIRCYDGYSGWMGYGDWLSIEADTPKELIGTAFFAHSSHLMAKIAGILGRSDDAARYQALFERVRAAFQARYVTPAGLIASQTQTAYILALHFDLLPHDVRAAAAAELVRDIQKRRMHLSAGFVGSPYITDVLTAAGRLDIAYALLHQTSWPSWLYSVTKGATTIWERWDGWTEEKGFQDPGMNSFNHYAYGAIGAWLYSVVAGIDIDAERPGYRHIVMRPRPGGELTSAWATLESQYGAIGSDWRLDEEAFDWEVVVPPNTSATVYVPASAGATVYEGEHPAENAPGVRCNSALRRRRSTA
jgi:alpha-L-rhamnosidase